MGRGRKDLSEDFEKQRRIIQIERVVHSTTLEISELSVLSVPVSYDSVGKVNGSDAINE